MQALLQKIVTESEKLGLSLNLKKTECMVITKKKDVLRCNIQIHGEEIKQVDKFCYLGGLVTSDGNNEAEIKRRVALAKESFTKMKSVLTNRNIKMTTKTRVLKCYVLSVLMYGCESWTLNKSMDS